MLTRTTLRAPRDNRPLTQGTEIRYSAAQNPNNTQGSEVKRRMAGTFGNTRSTRVEGFNVATVTAAASARPESYTAEVIDVGPSESESTFVGSLELGDDSGGGAAPVAPKPSTSSGRKSGRKRQKDKLPTTNQLVKRDIKRYGNTVPKGSFGSGSKETIESSPGSKVDTNVGRHVPGRAEDQPKTKLFQKTKPKPKGGQGGLPLGTTTRRQGEKPKGPAVKLTNYKDIRKKRLDAKEAARQARKEGTTVAVNASTFKQKNVRGSGIPKKSGKDESARPKERQTVAKLPSNYKKTEAEAFRKAKSWKDSKAKGKAAEKKTGIKTRPKAGSFGISEAGRKQAEANRAEAAAKKRAEAAKKRAEAAAKKKAEAAAKKKAEAAAAKKRAEAKKKAAEAKKKAAEAKKKAEAAKKKKAEASKPTGFGGLTSRRSSSRRSGSKSTSRGARGRSSSSSSRSRGGSSRGGSRSNSGSKSASRGARGSSSSRSRGGVSRGASRRTNRSRSRRRCDIRCKFDISILTNQNLMRDDLADVAYFVRTLKEINAQKRKTFN